MRKSCGTHDGAAVEMESVMKILAVILIALILPVVLAGIYALLIAADEDKISTKHDEWIKKES